MFYIMIDGKIGKYGYHRVSRAKNEADIYLECGVYEVHILNGKIFYAMKKNGDEKWTRLYHTPKKRKKKENVFATVEQAIKNNLENKVLVKSEKGFELIEYRDYVKNYS